MAKCKLSTITHLGFEILHYHAGRVIVFQAYCGSSPVRIGDEAGRKIQKQAILIDGENPLSEEEKGWLCGVDHA
jgi:hypothetical protein